MRLMICFAIDRHALNVSNSDVTSAYTKHWEVSNGTVCHQLYTDRKINNLKR